MLLLLLVVLVVAGVLGAIASRLRFSPWWMLLFAAASAAIALSQRAAVATCDARDSTEAVFAYAALIAVGLFATAATTSLFDVVDLARRGEKRVAAARLVPLVVGAALAFGSLVLWIATVFTCLA